MTSSKKLFSRSAVSALTLALCVAVPADAQERESLETLRQTTLGLINALVDKGVITRDVADAMLQQAKQKADALSASQPAAKPVQRIPYVSDAMRAQIRDELKEEIVTQAKAERWGIPNASPAWADRIKIDGDIRFRYQSDRPSASNTGSADYLAAVADVSQGLMRAPEYAVADAYNQPKASANSDRERERLRLRIGLTAKVTDEVGVGVRLATGNADDRVSTNQTLGNNFNKYQLFVDRAFMRVEPVEWLSVSAGRIPNPWFSTDMVWSENLNFEGAAMTARWAAADESVEPFATVGAFPLRDQSAPSRNARWLYGAQVGTSWQLAPRTRIKAGLAYYSYQNIEGREDTDYTLSGTNSFVPGPSFGQHTYAQGTLGQKGNTLFETNPVFAPTQSNGLPYYGLAYQFRPVVLTMSAEFTHFSPFSLLASLEYVRNTGFSVSNFQSRAGASYAGVNPGGRADGYHVRLGFGTQEVREQGQWLASVSYKRVGSDAVLDAFTDSDLGLGGTNVQGYSLAFAYGLYKNTTVGFRFLSSKSIESPINIYNTDAKFGVNSLQVDLNVRF
jgi:hypothetical protein